MVTLLSYVSLGLALIVAGLVVGLFMLLAALARTGKLPPAIVIQQGGVKKLIGIAMTGNVDALLAAAVDSFHLHLAEGGLPEKLVQAGLAEVQRNVSNTNGKTPIIDAIAQFTGKSRQQVFDLFKAELVGPAAPVPAPNPVAAPAVATALVLLCASFAQAASPTWGMPVKGPQRFYERDTTLTVDPPLMRDAAGQLVKFEAVHSQYVSSSPACTGQTCSIQPPANCTYCQPAYYQQPGFWNNGRWYPGKLIVQGARNVRGWFAHRRFRPLARLFGRG